MERVYKSNFQNPKIINKIVIKLGLSHLGQELGTLFGFQSLTDNLCSYSYSY